MLSDEAKRVYADILEHPHHRSPTRRPMPPEKRAAQFSAYDALAGYFDMIAEEARTTDAATELDANAQELLDQSLHRIAARLAAGERPTVSFTVFRPDERKAGGSYVVITDRVRRIDTAEQRVIFESRSGGGLNQSLAFASIVSIREEETNWSSAPAETVL